MFRGCDVEERTLCHLVSRLSSIFHEEIWKSMLCQALSVNDYMYGLYQTCEKMEIVLCIKTIVVVFSLCISVSLAVLVTLLM